MSYENLVVEHGKIARIVLNRPEKRNALNDILLREIPQALYELDRDDDVRVIILSGAGAGFCAGADLMFLTENPGIMKSRREKAGVGDMLAAIGKIGKIVIAQVHGFCIAGGCATASFCDLRICSEDALFGAPEIRIMGPYIQGVWPWIFGMTKARELLYTGNLIDAEEAYRLGFVNKVVSMDKLDEEVNKLAQTISKVPAAVVEYNKRLINMAYDLMNIRQVMERSSELEASCLTSLKSLPEVAQFQKIREEQGLNAAIKWNNARFAEEDGWWKKAKKKA